MNGRRAVAVTGIGVISPFGVGREALFEGLTQGRCAIGPLSVLEAPLAQVPVVGEIRNLPEVGAPGGLHLSRTDRLAVVAARQAAMSLVDEPRIRRDCAVVVSTTVAGLSDLEPEAAVEPEAYYRRGGLGPASTYPTSHPADAVARSLDLEGPRFGTSVACASGAMAIAAAARAIADGRASVALAGGSDALCLFTLAGFNALQALDSNRCRPFDESRGGLNIGEGAAMLLLEELGHARARGAEVLALVAGWASTNDAFHPTAPHEEGRGLAMSMTQAMRRAQVQGDAVGYVNAHGTGTRLNDVAEVRAYERAFAGRGVPVPVSSTKSHIGHTLGAAGAIEAVITLLALRGGVLIPTLRLNTPIATEAVDLLRGAVRPTSMDVAMSVSAGFGGSNTSLVFAIDRGGRSS
jgi:3-oxoacyl-(acyl-carrier-protein) synthase